MEKAELNLTRKWRSKNFQEVVGQPLAVRILQNSLYLQQFFPVYLFAGQRGCGKTSTARIFAAAVNCARLPEFQQDPRKVSIPCLVCPSCCAMSASHHPDFIEIDAASHTGVDNIRSIIDASSFLPLLGHKKIYLIDEAHMLSKAAFNAFLKILEEPPLSVIFILATTDMHKILETVKSRCFQIFFDPVDQQIITEHLEKLCTIEQIAFDQQGLAVIAKEAGGSVRDAINLLEQVRFATKKISKDAVLSILGHVDEAALLMLFEKIIQEDTYGLLMACQSLEKHELSIEYLWGQLTDLVYDAILLHYQVSPRYFVDLSPAYGAMIKKTSLERLTDLFTLLCSQEMHLARTTKKLRFLEMILLQFVQTGCQESKKKNNEIDVMAESSADVPTFHLHNAWQKLLTQMRSFDDLILVTMFQDAQCISFDSQTSLLVISFLKKFMLFKDTVEKEKHRWMLIVQNIFGHNVQVQFDFQGQSVAPVAVAEHRQAIKPQAAAERVSIADTQHLPLAAELMKHFDGVITEISRDMYE